MKKWEVLELGSANSGNRGHAGRPGHRGGSMPKGPGTDWTQKEGLYERRSAGKRVAVSEESGGWTVDMVGGQGGQRETLRGLSKEEALGRGNDFLSGKVHEVALTPETAPTVWQENILREGRSILQTHGNPEGWAQMFIPKPKTMGQKDYEDLTKKIGDQLVKQSILKPDMRPKAKGSSGTVYRISQGWLNRQTK